ncbi:hypothetical protein KP79_PYT25839 [Mizuhopecten yessoensis]|uniref:Uncharacterized protein n=1 Tax=Mizuhopecten yessoensis TaxID=6573 RepID=A0A210QJ85_MIZYE|nr:hypothetical protein KP79_PYT25839 [Mizuhopecten yessoensis]
MVIESRLRNAAIPKDWKNNNCESMNHIIKLLGDSKISKVPELIQRLDTILQLQYSDVRRSLHGTVDYELAAHAQHFKLSTVVWRKLSTFDKARKVDKFLKYVWKKTAFLTSTNGMLTIPKTTAIAKKTGTR